MVESTQVETGCIPYTKKVQYNFKPETISMIRQGFMSADSNKDDHIDIGEFGKMMKSFGHDELTEDKMKAVLAKFDTDKDGKISWLEYIDCYGECKGNFAQDYESFVPEKEDGEPAGKTFTKDNGIYGYTAFKEEEVHSFSNSINNLLEGDESVAERLPITSEHELFYGMSDGLLLIRLIQKLDSEAIFEGAVNKY